MLTIRLSRIGKRKKPMYRLIISEKAKDPYGRALEILGSYNPFTKDLEAKKERIEHWLSVGAQMSPTVNNLLVEKQIIKSEKVKASKPGPQKEEEKPAESAPAQGSNEPKEEKTEEAEKPAESAPGQATEEAGKQEKTDK